MSDDRPEDPTSAHEDDSVDDDPVDGDLEEAETSRSVAIAPTYYSKALGLAAFAKSAGFSNTSKMSGLAALAKSAGLSNTSKMLGLQAAHAKAVGLGLPAGVEFPNLMAAYGRGLVPRYNFSKLAGLDLGAVQFPLDVLKGAGTSNFAAAMLGVDLERLIPKYDFAGLAERLKEQWRTWRPPNWPEEDVLDLELVSDIVNDEGIPLVWVPRVGIVEKLLAAASREERVSILMDRRADLIIDCGTVLAEVTHSRLIDQHPLAVSAVQTLADGHEQSAQALAVLVTETAVKRAIAGRYDEVKNQVKFEVDEVPYTAFRVKAALAPIGTFFTSWFPGTDVPPPTTLSRHVSVHQADSVHYTPENAVLAVLLMASVLRALEESWSMDEPGQPAS